MSKKHQLQMLYDNEINATLSWFWDGGVNWVLGDAVNGVRKAGNAPTPDEAIDELWSEAVKLYPQLGDVAQRVGKDE